MNKRILTCVLAAALLLGLAGTFTLAKDLEPCNLCHATGRYDCHNCHGQIYMVCDGCSGEGGSVCRGEEGKGLCNNGYYTCPSCNGDGKCRSGDGQIVDGVCGNCGGAGKKECWICHGKGYNTCTRCNGTGKQECWNEDCIKARNNGWKCPKCMGTGYTLTNFWPGENDGVQNRPVKGDKIWVNGRSGTYGVDVGPGSGTGDGNGNKGNNNGNNSGNTGDPGDEPQTEPGTDAPAVPLPEDRNNDFDLPAVTDETGAVLASVRLEPGAMGDKQGYYAGLSDEELEEILSRAQAIVSTFRAGDLDNGMREYLRGVQDLNGLESLQDGRLYPISFDGHLEIGFPIRVTVHLERGALPGGCDLYVFHKAPDNKADCLGMAEYGTYEDGSVEWLSFYTERFSDFFTGRGEIDTELPVLGEDPVEEAPAVLDEASERDHVPLIIACVAGGVLSVAAAVTVLLLLKKRKENQ